MASWAPPYPGTAEKRNLVTMSGNARGNHLRAKMNPLPDVRMMMTSATSEAEDPVSENAAKEDDSTR